MNIMYVVEVVTSVGPISESRKNEIHGIMTKRGPLTFGIVCITAFPDRKAFRRFVNDIAWETKVWIAAEQFGIIHFDLIARTLSWMVMCSDRSCVCDESSDPTD